MKTKYKSKNRSDWPFQLAADGWYQLAPFGRFPNKDELSGESVVQVIDQVAAEAILADFNVQAGASDFAGLLIDYDHFSHDTDKSTVAAGWIMELEIRADGLYFKPRWSSTGESNLKSGCYRHVSPVFGGVYIDETDVRPMRLDRAGLTNDPNLKGMRPLSNRGGGDKSHNSHRTKENKSMKKLLALLGLSAEASEDSAADALTTLINRDTASQAELVTMKNRAETAEGKVEAAELTAVTAAADAFCETHKAKIKNRDVIRAQYIKDPEGTTALVEGLEVGKVSLHNRNKQQPGKDGEKTPTTNAAQLETKVQEYKAQNRCTYTAAFDAVKKANPELLSEPTSED